jgi:hypothetical protein
MRQDTLPARSRHLPATLARWGWFPLVWLLVGAGLLLSADWASAAPYQGAQVGSIVDQPTDCEAAGLYPLAQWNSDFTVLQHAKCVTLDTFTSTIGVSDTVFFASDLLAAGYVPGDYYERTTAAGATYLFPTRGTGTATSTPSGAYAGQDLQTDEAPAQPLDGSTPAPSSSTTPTASPTPTVTATDTPTPAPTDTATPAPTVSSTAPPATVAGEVTLSADQFSPLLATVLGTGCLACFGLGVSIVRRLF